MGVLAWASSLSHFGEIVMRSTPACARRERVEGGSAWVSE
jgi:hypothetical protein